MRVWVDAFLSLVFAPECAACGSPLPHPTGGAVCAACWHAVRPLPTPFCRLCGDSLPTFDRGADLCMRCQESPSAVDRARSAGIHDGALRNIVHALKYDGRRSLARPLAALMRERGREILDGADAVVPVPLHRSRRRQRGFNQSEDLARHLGLPVVKALARTRATTAQADLPADARRANVRDAFALTPAATRLSGLVAVLVDDVSTTGATLDACASALRRVRVHAVLALTAARAVMKQH